MKIKIFIVLIFACSCHLSSQTKESLSKIDSVQKILSNIKSSDSISIATQHLQLGDIYRRSLLSDSAYFHYQKAEKIYNKFGLKLETAITLFRVAIIQTYDKDYTGSEVTSFEAISILEQLSKTNDVEKYKAYIYNNLGIVFDELDLYDNSIDYYKLSLKIKKTLDGNNNRSLGLTLNNLIKVYRRSGQFDLAKSTYNEIISNENLIKNHPDVYVLALGNYAKTLFLDQDFSQLPYLYHKALKITDSIDYSYNSIILYQHLSEYYKYNNNLDSAKYYAYKAKDISENYHNDDLLKSLLLLSKVETDSVSAKHLKTYVKLNDSLQKNERSIRNKFARIRFETNKIEQENIQITKERMWLLVISIVIILASFLLYMVISQRNKNKELQFIQKQQETNEEIYNLMLSQNEGIEEARNLEKKKISQELHDGVLGRLFGTRLSLDSLNMSNSDEAIKTREQYINELKTIEDDIRKVSHELSTDFVSGSGFIDIIKTLVETQAIAYKLSYELNHDDIAWDSVTNKKKIHIYRIIQETLHNIYKHANANLVTISFKLKNNVICLIIVDDGSGFDVNKVRSGIGLKNINSRINEINGTLQINSEKYNGTTVTIEAPIP